MTLLFNQDKSTITAIAELTPDSDVSADGSFPGNARFESSKTDC